MSPSTSQPNAMSQAAAHPVLTRVIPYLPLVTQFSCSLMQLPAELRLMVLRDLLILHMPIASEEIEPEPLRPRGKRRAQKRERDARGRFVSVPFQSYLVTPAIIRTCQQLFSEALPILYHENTLAIEITMGASLRSILWSPWTLSDRIGKFYLRFASADVSMLDHQYSINCLHNGRLNHNLALCNHVQKFRNVSLRVSTGTDSIASHAQLRHMLKALAPLIYASNVEVTISTPGALLPGIELANYNKMLSIFTLLRCAGFRFVGSPSHTAIGMQNIITQNSAVDDLEDFLSNPAILLCRLKQDYSYQHPRTHELEPLLAILIVAVDEFNIHTFFQKRFEALRMWQIFTQGGIGEGSVDGEDDEFLVCHPAELGLEINNDGEELDTKLRALAVRYNFTPAVTSLIATGAEAIARQQAAVATLRIHFINFPSRFRFFSASMWSTCV